MSTPGDHPVGPLVPYGLKPGTPAYHTFVRNLSAEFSANLEEVLPRLTHWVGAYCYRIGYPDPDNALGEALCWGWRHACDAPADEDLFAAWLYRNAAQVAWRARLRHDRGAVPLDGEEGQTALVSRHTKPEVIVSRHTTGQDMFAAHLEAVVTRLGRGASITLSARTERVLERLADALGGYGAMSERAALYTAVLTILAERPWPGAAPTRRGSETVMRGARALLSDDKRTRDELLKRVGEREQMTITAVRKMLTMTVGVARTLVGESAQKSGASAQEKAG